MRFLDLSLRVGGPMQFLCVLPGLDGRIHPLEAYLEVFFLSIPILCVALKTLVLRSHTLVPVLIHSKCVTFISPW